MDRRNFAFTLATSATTHACLLSHTCFATNKQRNTTVQCISRPDVVVLLPCSNLEREQQKMIDLSTANAKVSGNSQEFEMIAPRAARQRLLKSTLPSSTI
jgi:hypothetical protein